MKIGSTNRPSNHEREGSTDDNIHPSRRRLPAGNPTLEYCCRVLEPYESKGSLPVPNLHRKALFGPDRFASRFLAQKLSFFPFLDHS
jgi:hypothetical protein